MELPHTRRLCPCGQPAAWSRDVPDYDTMTEHNVCFLSDADFEDDLCDVCFQEHCQSNAIVATERPQWQRVAFIA